MEVNNIRPLLAATLTDDNIGQLKYPLIGSPKLDGIRMRIFPGLGGVSRKHKLLPNRHLQSVISQHPEWAFFDGEVVVGPATSPRCFNQTQSAIMSEDGEPDFKYWVFDKFERPNDDYCLRFGPLNAQYTLMGDKYIIPVPSETIADPDDLLQYEARRVAKGYEGIMLRDVTAKYKFGRSTVREGILFKLKRFEDAEAVIVGMEPLERNNNELEVDELGYAKRSSAKDGKQADDLMGKIIVETPEWGRFNIGSGFDESARYYFWHNQGNVIGKTITFKYQKAGMKDVPRIPIFKGFRKD